MRKLIFVLFVIGLAIAPVSAQDELDRVTVLALPYLSFAPFYIAEKEGFFAEQNIEIEYLEALEDEAAFPALLNGDLDVHIKISDAALFNSIARGADIQVVADKGHFAEGHCASTGFIASRAALESGVLDSTDTFSEQHFSFETDTLEQYLLEMALAERDFDIDTDALTNDPLPPPVLQEALVSNTVQLGVSSEPWLTRAHQTGEADVWLGAEEIAPGLQSSMLIFGTSFLNDDPELGERFMVAYLQGVRQFREGATPRNLAIMSEFSGLDPDVIAAACWVAISDDGMIFPDGMMDFQQWLFDRGLLDRIVEIEEFWNPRFVNAANAALE